MNQPSSIVHGIARLDGYSTSVQLGRLVRQQLQQGQRVRVLALAAQTAVLAAWQRQGVDCQLLNRRWAVDPVTAWCLARCLAAADYDVLHVWDQAVLKYVLAIQAVRSPAVQSPVVATLWNPPADRVLQRWRRKIRLTLVTPFATPVAEQVIPPSLDFAVGTKTSRAEILAAQGLPPESRLIVMAGQLNREKNIEEALWSFELVRNINPQARLLILGDGPARTRWERFVRLASDAEAIRFLGYQHHPRPYVTAADVFWQAEAATPLAALEAMAVGVPVVAANCASQRALIDSGQTGYVAPLSKRAVWARHTLKILENKAHAAAIGKAGQVAVATHDSAQRLAITYQTLYQEVLRRWADKNLPRNSPI